MYKRLLFYACFAGIITFCASCRMNTLKGEGNKTTVDPTVAKFDALEVDIPIKVTVNMVAGTQPGIQLIGYENVIKHITTKVENNTLVLSTDLDDTWKIDGDGITVTVTMPAIIGLALSGSPDADIHGNIVGSTFDIDVSGASSINLDNVNVDSFSIEVSGAGSLNINAGTVKYAEYEIEGAGV